MTNKRHLLTLSILAYAGAYYFAYIRYLNPVWEYFGFQLAGLDGTRLALGLALILTTSLTQPVAINRPAPLTLFILYFNVYIPCVVTSLLLSADSIDRYGAILLWMSVVFVAAGIFIEKTQKQNSEPTSKAKAYAGISTVIWSGWAIGTIALLFNYSSIMSIDALVDIAGIYDQRVAGSATNPILAYTQTFYSSIFVPGLLAIGITTRNRLAIACSLLGAILMFSVTAQRTILLLPLIMAILHWIINGRFTKNNSASAALLPLSILMIASTLFHEESVITGGIALLLTFRTIAIPGLTVSQYEDLFSTIGRTHWSHVKGIDALIPIPDYAQHDQLWPNLGYMVGDRTYNNPIFNVNANLFAGDGVAAAGAAGVLVIGVVFICWLKLIERASPGWSTRFSCLVFMPTAIAMTNGHFFTTMLSFGGIFWIVALTILGWRSGARIGGALQPSR